MCRIAPPPLNVLLVDDCPDNSLSLSLILRAWGHKVWLADRGDVALTLARQLCPDVALLDIGLPDMTGWDLAVRLHSLPALRDLLVIAISGYDRPEDKARSAAVGFACHLIKPIDLGELQALLNGAWRRRAEG